MQFTKGGTVVDHMVSTMGGEHVPDLLGVDFFSKYDADITFATKSMVMQINGSAVEIPFSVNGHSCDSKLVSNVQQD